MRLVILALGLLAFPGCDWSGVPNMICKAERTVQEGNTVQGQMTVKGPTVYQYEATDVFRVANGKLYHRWSGREEYFYNDIRKVDFGRYVSGHMVFMMDYNELRSPR
jgi:hypothetical protein